MLSVMLNSFSRIALKMAGWWEICGQMILGYENQRFLYQRFLCKMFFVVLILPHSLASYLVFIKQRPTNLCNIFCAG